MLYIFHEQLIKRCNSGCQTVIGHRCQKKNLNEFKVLAIVPLDLYVLACKFDNFLFFFIFALSPGSPDYINVR